jgi:hypothetical protein
MTEQGYSFCPRCGTALVPGHHYCPKCGFNVDELSAPRDLESGDERREAEEVPAARQSSRSGPIILGALIVAAGLIGFGLLMRPQGVGTTGGPGLGLPGGLPGGSQPQPGITLVPSAPITGLMIQSPEDGATVTTKEITVIGLAPPGLKVTRDVSFGLDQHANADGTGHWAINVGLNDGQNELVFRIGDDRSTEKRLHVTFTPAAG